MSLISRFVEQLKSKLTEPEQRLSARAGDPWLFVEVNGHDYRARDWSVGGACLRACGEELALGQIVSGRLRWHKRDTGHIFTAEIMRLDPNGDVALRWLSLPDAILADMEPAEH
ncbi:MAG: PilZ domain-containing protein [Parvibaculum sp.]|nr:PilZ domain-containing protein [Parvibaculum sp.]